VSEEIYFGDYRDWKQEEFSMIGHFLIIMLNLTGKKGNVAFGKHGRYPASDGSSVRGVCKGVLQ
tara:strand:- start:5937 stop:6128 length:192 start_codon:yes stop_codon:yes gene_type:complete